MLTYNPLLMEFAVETRALSRTFGTKRAVDGIDLKVPAGSFYGFLGPNGAGKSTTIKCLTGLLRPSGGEIRILGIDPLVDPVEIKRRVGVVPEDLALFDRLTAHETLSFVGQVHGMARATFDTRAKDMLSLMDLNGAANTLVADFSHGMKKKLSLAAALLPAPRLLFLDEPFEGVDAVASRQIKDLLHGFVGRGGTVFLTSHILEIVERLAERFALIVKGEVVCCQTVSDLERDGTTLEQLYLGYAGRPDVGNLDWLGHR